MAINDQFEPGHVYNDPHSKPSTVGPQIYIQYWHKRALIEAQKEAYFGQMADVTNMPKHFGKTIKLFHYLPILDDRNVNDQGIDADGVSKVADWQANKTRSKYAVKITTNAAEGGMSYYFEGIATDATAAAAATKAKAIAEGRALAWINNVMNGSDASFTAAQTRLTGLADPWRVEVLYTGEGVVNYGNLYGSSKDIGTITGKLPALSETGGRVNRVGMTRITIEGTIEKFGFFEEYTQDSLDFDNDSELEGKITSEAVKAANEMTEDQLQIDLLNGAGVVRYAGDATSVATIAGGTAANLATIMGGTAVAGKVTTVTYDDLVKLGIELDNNRTPKNTRVITGSRMIDTKVINSARFMYIGSELLPMLMRMKDYHGEKAYIPVAQYGAATTLARGEVGSIADFRIIVVPEMMHWDAAGATVGDETDEVCYWSNDGTDNKTNVYPMLVVGDGSFTTIGFQTDGKTVKFRITHKRPGKEIADRQDPYGETGFWSIKWWYGAMILRPERLAVIKTAAIM